MRRILYTRSVDAWRWPRNQPDPVDHAHHDAVGRELGPAAVDARFPLASAMARLTPRQRAVLVARFQEDRTEVDAARVRGCSVSTVKSRTRHALERLRMLAAELAATFRREGSLR